MREISHRITNFYILGLEFLFLHHQNRLDFLNISHTLFVKIEKKNKRVMANNMLYDECREATFCENMAAKGSIL